jgi:pseudomonalisin
MSIRRKHLVVTSLAVAALLIAASAASAAVSGTSAWRVNGAQDLGLLPARKMTVTYVLTPRHASKLHALASSRHAKALTPAQFLARFGPSKKTVSAMRAWARANDLRVTSVSPNRLLVRVTGSSTQFARALHTSFSVFSSPATGSFFQITRAARLPRTFASRVTAVLGLSSLPRVSVPHPATRSATGLSGVLGSVPTLGLSATSISYPAAYDPQNFWSMYDAPSSETGSGQQLAIITEGDVSQPEKDLAQFEQTYKLPTVTWNQINVGTASSDTSGDDEWDLDSQYSTAFAPGVTQLDVYVGPSLDDDDILTTINRWVTDDISKQGSFSAGECELLAYAGGFTSGLDTVLEEAVAQGQTMFFASGDTGSQCPAVVAVNGVPAGIPGVDYPASSPYGIGAGGTSVLSPSGPTEIAWYAGGGGPSLLESTPAFQSSTKVGGVAPLETRGVPDVSLDADPESGYDVVVDGSVEVVGGTSACAPSWQGIWARAQGAHSGSLGFAGPVMYETEPASAYHDITLGTNGLWLALPGWDYDTGLGTPDIANFVAGA